MDTKASTNFWWMKNPSAVSQDSENNLVVPKLDLRSPSSIVDLLEKDGSSNAGEDVDVGSIIDEINRVAAQSPLGPYDKNQGERSIEDLMKEAERIYMESSKSFEQLSQRSKTSQNISDLLSSLSKDSTPTPKSISPLPMDPDPQHSNDSDDYTEDFSEESKIESNQSSNGKHESDYVDDKDSSESSNSHIKSLKANIQVKDSSMSISKSKSVSSMREILKIKPNIMMMKTSMSVSSIKQSQDSGNVIPEKDEVASNIFSEKDSSSTEIPNTNNYKVVPTVPKVKADDEKLIKLSEVIELKNNLIKSLEEDNRSLKMNVQEVRIELQKTNALLEQTKAALSTRTVSSPEINLELEKALEDLKDSREAKTALQLQLDTINKTHQLLKNSYEELSNSNKHLERRVVELDTTLDKYKGELLNLQQTKDKLLQNEMNLNKLLEIEKLQTKSLKLQNEKDSRCIQDLNRQIKEMERIIARKHPDSVSALIVAAKENTTDSSITARKILEDRIKALEQEQFNRESQNSKVFMEIQEKFNQMKAKYENHIEDLELHVSDLKNQLKMKSDTYDVYTQTVIEEKIPQKETFTVFTQTDPVRKVVPSKKQENGKEETHLLATIRGLQADLANKEKVVTRLQKEVDDLKKTNRRLQKEREGSLKNLSERRDFRSYPEKLALQARSNSGSSEKDFRKEEELQQVKSQRDRLQQQLKRMEDDYQSLKDKRILDLTALQDAHERETSNYVASVTPLREQLVLHQPSERKRAANFSNKEESILIFLAKKYRHIIDCRLFDGETSQKKNRCWDAIEEEFNARSDDTYRTKDCLRTKYTNLKKRMKKNAKEKCYSLRTYSDLIKNEITDDEVEASKPQESQFDDLGSEIDGEDNYGRMGVAPSLDGQKDLETTDFSDADRNVELVVKLPKISSTVTPTMKGNLFVEGKISFCVRFFNRRFSW
ncbi:unnamed protein product [Acanthoscelides obtectus]|uniref:Centrosomal protein of 162 kDa n=1 Tax=Acanthoscelides obtectus TaxID=200917 RepID=A0A9P0LRR6_ACAOB|nr:unnamed protein product [Acanthoscelides obtectus]CAK1667172.1 Centrosomal protein of 162 kDa [Acanthoscelides obtectus]